MKEDQAYDKEDSIEIISEYKPNDSLIMILKDQILYSTKSEVDT